MAKPSDVEGQQASGELLAGDEGNMSSPRVQLQAAAAEAEEIWTAAAMEEAEPIGIEIDDATLQGAAEAAAEAADLVDPSAGPGGVSAGELPETLGEDDIEPTATSGGYNYPGPYTVYEVSKIAPYTKYPYVTVGKLFFKQNGNSYVGSAASIGNYAVFTAGHCVHTGNGKASGWSTNVVFVPAYKNGSAPLGMWKASYLTTRTKWYNNGIPNGLTEDMGGAILHPLNGKKISQRVGSLGAAWNWGRFQHWHAVGYPAASPYNGKLMWDTQASYAYNGSVSGIKPVAIGCNMTGGCSGGPWIRKFGSANQLNGVNSYRRSNKPEELLSPYFDNRAKSLLDSLWAGTP